LIIALGITLTGILKKRSNFRWFVYAPIAFLSFFPSVVHASNPVITEPTDYWFEYSEPTIFVAQTYYIDGFNSDPQLWLYNEAGTLLISNDDSYGLQSFISFEVPAGRYRLRAGTCCWQPDVWRGGNGWNEKYELAFDGVGSMQTTTTEVPTTTSTTSSTTTSTIPETTTSTSTTTTSTSTTTTSTTSTSTTIQPTTTTSTSTTTSTTTTVPITTTTEVARTTTTTQQPTTSSSSTTSTIPETTTTVYQPISTSTSSTTVSVTTSTTDATTSTSSTSLPVMTTTISPTTTTVLPNQVTPAEAATIASDTAALAQLDTAEAKRVFEALSLEELPPDEVAQIIAAVQNAPVAIREAFEAKVNVFSGAADTYVPIGSKVDIKTRRVIVVSTAIMIVMPPPPPVRRKQ
jgi:hypothetical protein